MNTDFSWSLENNVLYFEGDFNQVSVPLLDKDIANKLEVIEYLNLSGLTVIDPAGIVYTENLVEKISDGDEHKKKTMCNTLPEHLQPLWSTFAVEKPVHVPEEKTSSFLLETGDQLSQVLTELRSFFVLSADTLYWTAAGLFRLKDRRKGSVMKHCYTMGVEALGIIALLSFILGFILALQSAIQLRQFGAGLMVANLLTLALVHEMGPIMTSIIIAGRTGSSVAAEIATMKVTEELDALKMMALDPIKFVLVPKVMAITMVIPLLLTISIIMGVLGGAVVGVIYIDVTPLTYLQQSISVVVVKDVIRSYAKTVIFAWVIVMIGAHYGFHVKGGSEGVGRATTQSVVAAIFAILVLDALFSFTLLLD